MDLDDTELICHDQAWGMPATLIGRFYGGALGVVGVRPARPASPDRRGGPGALAQRVRSEGTAQRGAAGPAKPVSWAAERRSGVMRRLPRRLPTRL